MSTTTAPGTYQGQTAEQWREKARRSHQASYESFERSDTDGFLSQWASDVTAGKYECYALLAEDPTTTARVLFDAQTGEVASTHTGWGQYGQWWRLEDQAALKYGKRFFSPSKAKDPAKRHAADKAKGFTEGIVRAKGYVAFSGGQVGGSYRIFADVEAMKAHDFTVETTDAGPDTF